MKKIFLSSFLFFILVSPLSVFGAEQLLTGCLLYTEGGNVIYLLNLETAKKEVVYKDKKFISGITAIDRNTILINQDNQIIRLDLSTKELSNLHKGLQPVYLSSAEKVIFYDTPNYQQGRGIYAADMAEPMVDAKRIITTRFSFESIVPISNSEMVFAKDNKAINPIYKYNFKLNEMSKLSLDKCTYPVFWRSQKKQLVCLDQKQKNYISFDLSGQKQAHFNFEGSPVVYLSNTDQLIIRKLSKSTRNEQFDLYLYDLKKGKEKLIYKNAAPVLGQAIYFLQKPNFKTMVPQEKKFNEWLTFYYLHPEPEKTPKMIDIMIQHNAFNPESQNKPYVSPIPTFLSQVFKQNPNKMAKWMKQIKFSSNRDRAVMYRAIWNSDTTQGKQYLFDLTQGKNVEIATIAKKVMTKSPEKVLNKKITEDVLDQLWVSFFSTGDRKYIEHIISVLFWDNPLDHDKQLTISEVHKALIIMAAKWSLRANAKQHKKVFKICEGYGKARANKKVKELLDKLLYENNSFYYVDTVRDRIKLQQLTESLKMEQEDEK